MGMKGVTSAMVSEKEIWGEIGVGFWVARVVESWVVEEEGGAPAARYSDAVKSGRDGSGGGCGGGAMPRAET